MKDKVTGIKIRCAEAELIRCFSYAEATSNLSSQDFWLNKAIEQEAIIKQLKGK